MSQKNKTINKIKKMKKIKFFAFLLVAVTCNLNMNAQLSGTYNVPGTFSTIAAAISSLNAVGVSGNATITIDAGYTETAPVGGYSLTATGTATSTITFIKNGVGANPLITANVGASTPGSAVQDGVFMLIGSDYVTIDGIDITDPNLSNPATMEYGYGLFKASAMDGCQNNTIQNCVITLNRANNATGAGPATDGSRGIDVVNALTGSHTTAVTTTSISGANSNNRFYSNTIQNCNIGIALIGYTDVTPFTNADQNNDIGGVSAVTGNTIINYGGGAGATNPAAAIRTLNQYSLNVSYNTIHSNNGGGVNHASTLRGIFLNTAPSAGATISNNTITVRSGATTSNLTGIENASGATAAANTINILNNLITNCTYATATSGVFAGIINSASCATLNITGNTFLNNSTGATSGTQLMISNSGAVPSSININSNSVNGFTYTSVSAGTFNQISNSSGTGAAMLSISNNTFQNITHNSLSSTAHNCIINSFATLTQTLSNNQFVNISVNSTGGFNFMSNNNALPAGGSAVVNSNSIIGTFNKNGAGGSVFLYFTSTAPSSISGTLKSEQFNNFSNITLTGATTMSGWADLEGAVGGGSNKTIANNTFTNWVCGSNAVIAIQTNFSGPNTSISNNTLNSISGTGAITGISVGSSNAGASESTSANSLSNFNSTGTGGAVIGITGGSGSITNYSVFANSVSSLSTTGTGACTGINQSAGSTVHIFKNKIYDLQSSNAAGAANGLVIAGGTNVNGFNNIIGDIRTPMASAANPLNGINVTGGTTINMYYNTVRLNAVSAGANFGSSAIFASSTPGVNLRNNIFINNSTPNGTGFAVAYRRSTTTLTSYSATSNNNLFYAGTPGATNLIMYDGTNSYQTISAYQTAVSPRDAASVTQNVAFLSLLGSSPNFLHIDPAISTPAESGAVNIAGITDDFDANIRQGNIGYVGTGTSPDIGADEFEQILGNCNLVSPAAITPSAQTICAGQSAAFTGSGYTTGAGIIQQWQVSTNIGGPYSNVVGGVGQNNPASYVSAALTAGIYYYVLLTTCTISGNFILSNEVVVNVNTVPTVTVSPINSAICMPGGSSVTLNAGGATTYTWGPAAGLSSTTGISVNALPASTTVYTVTGAAGGCTAVATTTVVISIAPSILTISATPSVICAGGNSSLNVLGASTTAYTITNIPYAPVTTPSTGVTTLANLGTQATPLSGGSLDDGYWSNLNLPFQFSFFGNTYSTFAVGTNGYVFLGAGNPQTTTGYNNAQPSTTPNRPTISAHYSDLDWDQIGVGVIETFTTGVAPNRQLVVNWTGGQYWSNTGSITVQAIIYETSQIIEVHTFQSTGVNNAVEGIQNAAGNVAFVVPGRNNVSVVVGTPDAYRWTPGTVSYSWTPSTYLNQTNISNPIASTVTTAITYTAIVTGPNGCTSSTAVSLSTAPDPTVSIVGTTSICAGGTVNLLASGANTYSWSTGANTPGITDTPTNTITYSVVGTSTDGCTANAFQTVTVNAAPSVSITGTSSICTNGTVNLLASGASSYSWSTGAITPGITDTPTINTTYSVIGTSTAGCDGTAMLTVTINTIPTVAITGGTNVICAGSSVNLSASGANSYSWNTGAITSTIAPTPTVNTAYSVIGTSNGCTNTAVQNVTVIASPTVVIAGTTQVCAGGSVNLTTSGAVSYTWSTGSNSTGIVVSPTANTTYSVVGTNSIGCTGIALQTITVNPLPTLTITPSSQSICVGSSATLTGSGASTYSWNTGSGSVTIVVSPTVSTTYTLNGISSAGCSGAPKTFSLLVAPCVTGLSKQTSNGNTISVYPNPNTGIFIIEMNNDKMKQIEITDIAGRIIYTENSAAEKTTINLNDFAKGIYYVKIVSENVTETFKMIKQ
jgi:hypothetical protein